MGSRVNFTALLAEWCASVEKGDIRTACNAKCDEIKVFTKSNKNVESCVKNILIFLTTHILKHQKHVEVFTDLASWAVETLKEKKWTAIKHLWNYVMALYKFKDLWPSLMTITPAMCIKESEISQEHFKMLLDLTKYMAVVCNWLNRKQSLSDSSHSRAILENFSELLRHVVSRKDFAQFVESLKLVFDRKYLFSQNLMSIDESAGSAFLANVLEMMELFAENQRDKELFFVITDLWEIFMSFELKNENSELKLSSKLLHIWPKSKSKVNLEDSCIETLQALSSVLVKRQDQDVENVCRKYRDIVELLSGSTKESVVVETFAATALILEKHSERLTKMLSISASVELIRSINTMISMSTENGKIFCKSCNTNTKKHCIVTLISVAFNLFAHANNQADDIPTIVFEAIIGFIKHNFYIIGRLKCPERDAIALNSLRSIYNTFLVVKQKNVQQYVVRVMQLLMENLKVFNIDRWYQQNILNFLFQFYTVEHPDMRQALNAVVLKFLHTTQHEKLSFEDMSKHIKKYIHYNLYEFREMAPTNLVDVIEDESFKWYGDKVDFDACELLLAQIASYETLGSKSLYLCAMRKLLKITKNPRTLTEALIFLPEHLLEDFKEMFSNLSTSIAKEKDYPDKCLHEAFLHYANFLVAFTEKKSLFERETVTEEQLIRQEWNILEKINGKEEKNVIHRISNSVLCFETFAKQSPEKHRQVTSILKILKTLAFQAKMHGLVRNAVKIYHIMYNISSAIDNKEFLIIALSNILFYWQIFEVEMSSDNNNINLMMEKHSTLIQSDMENIHEQEKKYQGSIITCFVYYALYCAAKGRIVVACEYLQKAHSTIRSANSTKHLHVFFLAVTYLMTIKYGRQCDVSHVSFMEDIIRELRSGVSRVSREITFMLPLEVVRELVDYSVLRFDCNGINSYVLMMLKWFLGSGMMLQVADILLLSAKIDLAEEKVQQCKSKLFYYMAILQLDKLGNCEWLESWQKQENATLNSVMETPWHDIQSACAFFSHHKKDCECLLCLQYKTEDVSCQMNLFFMWMLFIERQYDRVRDIHQSVAKANGTLQPVQPYELKTRAFFASALAQLKTPQSALKEFLKLQQISESMRSHRTALYQGFELQILSVKHLMNSNQATTKGKTMFEERLEMCSPNDSGKKVVKGKERKSKLPVKKERQPKVEKKEEISSGQVKRTTRSSNRN